MTEPALSPPKIRFRGRSFLALMLAPEQPLEGWLEQLDALIQRSPGFFAGRPVVLDLLASKLARDEIAGLIGTLATRHIRVMAIEGRLAAELGPDMPPSIRGGRDARIVEPEAASGGGDAAKPAAPAQAASATGDAAAVAPEPAAQTAASPLILEDASPATSSPSQSSLLLDQPVRSGQSVTFLQGDVTVMGAISSGAEVVAGGSIHVYGALRGRAIAGMQGNGDARIFCRKLEAELLAIDGFYITADDMDPQLRGQAVQAWLKGHTLKMASLN